MSHCGLHAKCDILFCQEMPPGLHIKCDGEVFPVCDFDLTEAIFAVMATCNKKPLQIPARKSNPAFLPLCGSKCMF